MKKIVEYPSKGKGLLRGGIRGYDTGADRARGVAALYKLGYRHFAKFRDVQATYALSFSAPKLPQHDQHDQHDQS